MSNKNKLQNKTNIFNKINTYLLSGSFVFVLTYVVLIGLTSVNVATVRSISKNIEDKKNELSMVEIGYMSNSNMMALESSQSASFAQAENIAYVNVNSQPDSNTVAIANINN